MIRSALAPFLLVLVAACSPVFDQEIRWTIDGADPAEACKALDDAAIELRVTSRDNADERFGGTITETTATAPCGDGSATIQTGPFADILARIKVGDDVVGVAAPVSVSPGAPASGYAIEDEAVVADIHVTRSALDATLTVLGRSCGDAGAATFTVSLFENTEPRTNVPVETDVEVPCTDGDAVYRASNLRVGATYLITATTSAGGLDYATAAAGEGFVARGAATDVTIDLALAD